MPEAYALIRDRLLALLDEYDIGFLKWDQNRDLVDAAHAGRPAVHGQTLAAYRLMDELKAAPPRPRDRELLVGRGAGRPRGPRAHRPGVGQRLQRRAGAAGDPALDRAVAAARAGRQPRGTTGLAHHRTRAPVGLPRGHRAVRPLRDRVGRRRAHRRQSATSWPRGWRCTRPSATCCTAVAWCAATTPTRRCGCTAWCRPRATAHCSRPCSWRRRRQRCRCRCGCPGSTLPGPTGSRWPPAPTRYPVLHHPPSWTADAAGLRLTGAALARRGRRASHPSPESALVLRVFAA